MLEMRKRFFIIALNISQALISFNESCFAFVDLCLTKLKTFVNFVIASISYFFLRNINSQRLRYYENIVKQTQQNSTNVKQQQIELDLLTSVQKLRDHAVREGDWTDNHSIALEAIGNALIQEMDWEEDLVHQYLKEVVETIPGLYYGNEEA